jgi:hypothetical protein
MGSEIEVRLRLRIDTHTWIAEGGGEVVEAGTPWDACRILQGRLTGWALSPPGAGPELFHWMPVGNELWPTE